MKGDFTRSTFRPEKHYRSVLMQQGRVQLDADWNEQIDIQQHLDGTTRIDAIGACGAPKDGGGFALAIAPDASDLTLSPGRIYVGGVLCELEATPVAVTSIDGDAVHVADLMVDGSPLLPHDWIEVFDQRAAGTGTVVRVTEVDPEARRLAVDPSLDAGVVADLGAEAAQPAARRVTGYTTQPDLPSPPLATPAGTSTAPTVALRDGTYLAYLDVWERHVTALEDGGIRETALGGPDTATRARVVWQLRLAFVQEGVLEDCAAVPGWEEVLRPPDHRPSSSGRMRARARPEAAPSDVCELPPQAGYRRLENQLYRVEVHQPGALGTATFKWSRDNGSVATRWTGQDGNRLSVADTGRDAVLGFASGQLVELVDDGRELRGEPGTLVSLVAPPSRDTLTIDPATPVDRGDFPGNPRIRRWDSPAEATVEVPSSNDGWIPLEGGIEVRFEDGYYNTGDYWLIPARTPVGDVEWPRDDLDRSVPRAPEGIGHHYCGLALIRVHGGAPVQVVDCRPRFPSLTSVGAEDVGFDNSACQLPDTATVQDALEVLCEEHTLRHHKKHLHGWGIVCGLRAVCGPDPDDGQRAHVTVRSGYAIDCEGNDILVNEDITLDVMRMIEEREREEDEPLLADGNGEVCLLLDLDAELRHRITLERYDPATDRPGSLVDGTLLGRFYEDCIKKIQDFLEQELRPGPGARGKPAGPAQKRQAVLANLLAEVVNPEPGKTIHISAREDRILRGFYERLRALLQSETFCAMFDNARPFPPYPDTMPEMDSVFGTNHHVRLRLRPGGAPEAYTVGPGLNPVAPSTWINRYDLRDRALVAEIDPIAGAEQGAGKVQTGAGGVQDVAFSPDGKRLYMVAPTRTGENTFFRAGEIGDRDVRWGPLTTICGVKLVSLATTAADPRHVYAVGLGRGLYRIDPDAVDPNMQPAQEFRASGHLELTRDGRGFATAAADVGGGGQGQRVDPPLYDQIVAFQRVTGRAEPVVGDLEEPGVDGIALSLGARGTRFDAIYCVVGRDGSGRKRVVGLRLEGNGLFDTRREAIASVPVEDTSIALAVFAATGSLLLTYEDGYCARVIDLSELELLDDYVLPAQVGPISIATDDSGAYILNHVSNTITVAPAEVLDPQFRFPLEDLAGYRKAVLEAFADLMAGFAQYLKDCLCDLFLVDCPQCTGDEELYLACVSVREGQVYQVCNFSRRRYVKSFPTVGYWLSLVPILPFLDRILERFCCMVLPELAERYEVAPFERDRAGRASPRMSARTARGGMAWTQTADPLGWLRRAVKQVGTAGSLTLHTLTEGAVERPRPAGVGPDEIVGRPVEEVETLLADRGIATERAPFEPRLAPGPAASVLRGLFRVPRPGTQITLHERHGRVRSYSVSQAVPAAVEAELRSVTQALEERDAELQRVREQLQVLEQQAQPAPEAVAAEVSELREELRAVQAQMADLARGTEGPPDELGDGTPAG